ncbi:hypothetical protein C0J52_08582 [Blattella germanica]|nr:hypothetical protein C0J52_08582 [Blattella germanica]
MPLRYNVNGDYAVFSRMKEKGISLAAFATTVLFLILTVVMTDYNRSILPYWITDLPPSYAVATSGSTSCADTTEGMNANPPPPPYSSVVQIPIINNLSTEQQQTVNAANIHNLSLPPLYTPRMPVEEIGPPVRVHSLRIKSNSARKSDCDTRSLDGRLSDRGHSNCAFSDNNSTC